MKYLYLSKLKNAKEEKKKLQILLEVYYICDFFCYIFLKLVLNIFWEELFEKKTKKEEIMSKILDKFRDDIYFKYLYYIFFLYERWFVYYPKIHYLKKKILLTICFVSISNVLSDFNTLLINSNPLYCEVTPSFGW